MLVSVHVPKTGGGSLTRQIRNGAFGRYLLDYQDRPLSDSPSHALARLWSRLTVPLRARALSEHDIIHGHFPADKYRSIADAYMIFLRDPVERTLSHYYYWKSAAAGDSQVGKRNRVAAAVARGEVDIVEFAYLQRGIYRMFLGGMEMEQFDVVGLTEQFEKSIALVNRRFHVALVPLHVRRNVYPRTYAADIEKWNEENYECYRRGRERFEKLVRELA